MASERDFDFYCAEALTGKTPVKKVFESDRVMAFWHTKPFFERHVVVIPKRHIHDFIALDDNELLLELMGVARRVMEGWQSDGVQEIRLLTNIGHYQTTPHLHFHVLSGKRLKNGVL